MILCDKCHKPIENSEAIKFFENVREGHRICDDCGLVLDRFLDTVEHARGTPIEDGELI